MATLTTGSTGNGRPIENRQPVTTLNYAIALQGAFPSRNLSIDPFLGAVGLFAGNFAPRGWALAQGQLLPIAENTALFAILGTTYGGDGRTTFGLPDLRGRVPIGAGTGPGLSSVSLGEKIGSESITLSPPNLPSHSHTVPGQINPTGQTGADGAFSNQQPSLGLNPIISLTGTFPSRSLSQDPLIGSISWFAGNFAPRGWAFAHGQLLSIAENNALFAILGTTYGGDGRTTFALPDLRGRTPIHTGQGDGLSNITLGQQGGTENIALSGNNLPTHTHTLLPSTDVTDPFGNGAPYDNRQPFLGVNYQIALSGIFPSRSLEAEGDLNTSTNEEESGFRAGQSQITEVLALQHIETLAQEGIRQWISAGISTEQAETLRSINYQLEDLDPGSLAFVGENNVVTIDLDGASRGWFIDPTPSINEEFGATDPVSGELYATESEALHHFDLLTAIMHEQGHVLGLEHTSQPGQIMYGGLGIGGRLAPMASDLLAPSHADTGHAETSDSSLSGSAPLIAGVGMFAGNFSPRGWAATNGQTLNISDNNALFALLGTTYGGDGRTTFDLPDLRGRAVVGAGQGDGLSNYVLGSNSGTQEVSLTVDQIPAHTHLVETTVRLDTGDLIIDGVFDSELLTLSIVDDALLIADPSHAVTAGSPGITQVDANTVSLPITTITGANGVIINSEGGNDQVTLDFSGVVTPAQFASLIALPGKITVNGGGQDAGGSDSLVLTGSPFGGVTPIPIINHSAINENDGTVSLSDGINAFEIDYTGLEPITDNLSAVDRVFNFSNNNNTITLSDDGPPGDGVILIDSDFSESVAFTAPTTSLTINDGIGDSRINLAGIVPLLMSFPPTITVNSNQGNDRINAKLFPAATTLNGEEGNDTLISGNGDDTISGGFGNDVLIGNQGDDVIVGGADDDRIVGGGGADTLQGGLGRDRFVFKNPRQQADTIIDFDVNEDLILLKGSAFGDDLSKGRLPQGRFTIGRSATDRRDRVIYNDRSGGLFFDPDGFGPQRALFFAALEPNLELSNRSFRVI